MTQNNNPFDENNLDIEKLSTILTDKEIRPKELDPLDKKKENDLWNSKENVEKKEIIDININEVDDLLFILLKNEYDFVVIEPTNDLVKLSFKKDSILKDLKYIKYHTYSSLVIKLKTISKLDLTKNNIEQKWDWLTVFREKAIDILVKSVPSNFWETIFLKAKLSEKKVEKKQVAKKWVSASTAFWFLWGILFIALILWGAFLTFVIINAKTPEDVAFFASLWISLNDINSFLLTLTTTIFSIVIIIETILLIIVLFKALFTKKDQKRKKVIFSILSIIMLIIAWSSVTLWMYLDKTIKQLPNWLEYSYWLVQIYDNNLLNDEKIWKSWAIISDTNSIIWPIDIKLDVTYLQKDEQRQWFAINKYIWNFWNWKTLETKTPDVIYTFDKKWNYKISLTLEWVDTRFREKWVIQKPASEQPEISVAYVVDIKEKTLENWWKTISFNANELKPLWEVEWYLEDDLTKPAYTWYNFQPSKVYFEKSLIWMKLKNSKNNYMNRIFTISWEKSSINWKINQEVSIDNDLEYTFKVSDIENNFWDWFIEEFIWTIDGKEYKQKSDKLNMEESSKITYKFTDYWDYNISVKLINSNWESNVLTKKVTTTKKMKLNGQIDFYINNSKINDVKYDQKTNDYSIYNIWNPTKINFDAKTIKSDNSLYVLDSINWDVKWDGSNEGEWKIFEYEFNFAWFEEVLVKYKFKHRRDKNLFLELTQKINLEFVEKEADLSLNLKSDTEYAPALVAFDASLSKIKNDDIIKFIYDYWDGIVEERDATNSGHRYLKEWNYKVKLTVVTRKWKEYSITKDLILKPLESSAKINVSMKKAPTWQEIDFLSSNSLGQIVAYHWDFWDWSNSPEANPSHAYKKPWKYKVVLTIDLANNNVMSDSVEIEIE